MAARLLRLLSRSAGSTPVRQAALLVAVFATVNLVTLGLAYLSLRRSAEDAMRANLAQLAAGFEVAASPRAAEILVTAAADAADPAHRVFAFIAPDGRVSGNAEARLTAGGVEIRPMPEGRPLGPDDYLPLIERRAGGVLIIGESLTPIRDLGRTFLGLLALSLGPTVLISLGLGAALAARARARVERIEAALARLSEGALDTRIPADPGRADDLARIGARINRMAEAQEAATEALRQVSSDIAHDLKTPLQRMTVLLNDLSDGLGAGSREAGLATRALAEAEGAVAVFQGLLRIAQIEGGGARLPFAPVDLNALATRHGRALRPRCGSGRPGADGRTLDRAAHGRGRTEPHRPGAGEPDRERAAPHRRRHRDRLAHLSRRRPRGDRGGRLRPPASRKASATRCCGASTGSNAAGRHRATGWASPSSPPRHGSTGPSFSFSTTRRG